MRDPRRIEPLLKVLTEIWYQAPDMRFGQLLMTLGYGSNTCFYEEDEDAYERLQKELSARRV